MVEQNGRQIMAAVQAANWPTRQMALAVPSWQQLTAAANGPSAAAAAVAAAAADNILQPLFAAAAEADWRRPLIVDSSGSLRLQEQAVFPVYDRATMAATSVAAAVAANSREAALVAQQQQQQQQQRQYNTNVSSGSKRSTKPSQLTLHNINNSMGGGGGNINGMGNLSNNPPPAHINTHLYSSAMRYVKKELT
jgi:transcriptional regulator of acetoin/glycerol metabolism